MGAGSALLRFRGKTQDAGKVSLNADGERPSPSWVSIGVDHSPPGLNVVLDAIPPDGRIFLLERDDDDDARLQREAALFQGAVP
jgi:hypothetical protein